MRVRNLLLGAAVVLCAAAPARAQTVIDQNLGLEFGASMPTGDFSDAAGAGWNIGAQYEAMMANFGMGGEIKYHGWGASDDFLSGIGSGSDGSFAAWQYDVYGIAAMTMPKWRPYAKAGLGWYSPSMKITTPTGDTNASDTNFGIVVGAGADFDTPSTMKAGVGFSYHRLQDSTQDFWSMNARMTWPLKLGH